MSLLLPREAVEGLQIPVLLSLPSANTLRLGITTNTGVLPMSARRRRRSTGPPTRVDGGVSGVQECLDAAGYLLSAAEG